MNIENSKNSKLENLKIFLSKLYVFSNNIKTLFRLNTYDNILKKILIYNYLVYYNIEIGSYLNNIKNQNYFDNINSINTNSEISDILINIFNNINKDKYINYYDTLSILYIKENNNITNIELMKIIDKNCKVYIGNNIINKVNNLLSNLKENTINDNIYKILANEYLMYINIKDDYYKYIISHKIPNHVEKIVNKLNNFNSTIKYNIKNNNKEKYIYFLKKYFPIEREFNENLYVINDSNDLYNVFYNKYISLISTNSMGKSSKKVNNGK